MEINSISIVEVKTDDKILQLRSGDIVTILLKDEKELNPSNCTIKGKINFIDTNNMELDCSKEYQSDTKTIKFKDIRSLFKIN